MADQPTSSTPPTPAHDKVSGETMATMEPSAMQKSTTSDDNDSSNDKPKTNSNDINNNDNDNVNNVNDDNLKQQQQQQEQQEENYDVILCGTDLIQSILSSALSRAGKKVLHCDGNEWYGGFDAVLYHGGGGASTLESFIEGCCREGLLASGIMMEDNNDNENDNKKYNNEEKEEMENHVGEQLNLIQLLCREKYARLKLHSQTFIAPPLKSSIKKDGENDANTNIMQDAIESLEKLECKEEAMKEEEEGETKNTNTDGIEKETVFGKTSDDNINDKSTTTAAAVDNEATNTSDMNETLTGTTQQTNTNNEKDTVIIENEETNPPLEHGFAFDLTPSLLYASGDAVQGMIKSGVSDYLEFKSLKGLYLLMVDNSNEEEEGTKKSWKRGGGSHRRRGNGVKGANTPRAGGRDISQDANKGGTPPVAKDIDTTANSELISTSTLEIPPVTAYRVPCSKGDVFRSKLLSPVDKRRLMKFLQLISDYGMTTQFGDGKASSMADSPADTATTPTTTTATTTNTTTTEEEDNKEKGGTKDNPKETEQQQQSTEDNVANSTITGEDAVHSVNERHLHRGRALSRPQNKAMPSSSDMDALMRCVHDNVSFTDFLTTVVKLPTRLCTVVVYALALAPFSLSNNNNEEEEGQGGMECDTANVNRIYQYSTKEGVEDLLRHITALGRFGDTAFLVPMYGSGELSQAFCRSGAVYGSTYMLRRSPLSILLEGNDTEAQSVRVRGVVLSGEEHIGGSDGVDTEDVSDKEFLSTHVIVPSTMLAPTSMGNTIRTHRRISILKGKLMTAQDASENTEGSDSEQRYAIVIPPGTRELGNKSAIHGVAFDDSVFVTPSGSNYTVLHLTTSTPEESGGQNDDAEADILGRAVHFLTASQRSKGDESTNSTPVIEYHHIAFSYSTHISSPGENNTPRPIHASGLHICHRDKQSLTCDAAFIEAERIFNEICPDSEFLALAKQVEDAIVYKNVEESDDEKMVLDSAVGIIQAPAVEEPPLADVKEDKKVDNDTV